MAETSSAAPSQPAEGVEIGKVAEYNGQPLFNLELESLEDKPWRKPGIGSIAGGC
jgi:pre-mRNA 3'-end-processing factor FIP1